MKSITHMQCWLTLVIGSCPLLRHVTVDPGITCLSQCVVIESFTKISNLVTKRISESVISGGTIINKYNDTLHTKSIHQH